jgi:hypothetical protein
VFWLAPCGQAATQQLDTAATALATAGDTVPAANGLTATSLSVGGRTATRLSEIRDTATVLAQQSDVQCNAILFWDQGDCWHLDAQLLSCAASSWMYTNFTFVRQLYSHVCNRWKKNGWLQSHIPTFLHA